MEGAAGETYCCAARPVPPCYRCPMPGEDLNLLIALDALLAENSVAGAARRLGLSASAMSRTLVRLRSATGDPLLVRAGRALVPTPSAADLRERVEAVTRDAREVLRPAPAPDMVDLTRTFTLRANEGFVDSFAARLIAAAAAAAPGVRLRFAPKPDKDVRALREGQVDLEIGVVGDSGPEVRIQALFRDGFVGAVRRDHPLGAIEPVTPEAYAACGHVVASRRGRAEGPVDAALAALGLGRRVVAVVPGFPAALAVAEASNLVALVTRSFIDAEIERRAVGGRSTLRGFALPIDTPAITVSQMWHPRMDADPTHRWLRTLVLAACRLRKEG